MENASKALLMAGGVLIAIIILSLIVYMGTTTSRLAKTQDEKTLAEQTEAFNKEYEAYDKKKMYGTDVITVVNKAIEYNQSLGTDSEDYFIDIVLDLRGAEFNTTTVVTWEASGDRKEEKTYSGIGLGNKEYHLKTGTGRGTGINQELKDFFAQPVNDLRPEPESDGNRIKTTLVYSGLASFKRAIFSCTRIEYSKITGRVNLIEIKFVKS